MLCIREDEIAKATALDGWEHRGIMPAVNHDDQPKKLVRVYSCEKDGGLGKDHEQEGREPSGAELDELLRIVTAKSAKILKSWLPKPATRWVPQWDCSLSRKVVTKVRTDQARKSAILRIVTGESLFTDDGRKDGRKPGASYTMGI